MITTRLTLPAYAKINLILEVLGRRDDGYHWLNTVFNSIDLHDTITLEADPGLQLETTGGFYLPEGMENLAFRAARLVKEESGFTGGVKIILEKRIPVAAGLAGGSSDAAAVLRGLNCLWGLGWPISRLLELGGRLGADVPFCILGGTAWGQGVGDELTILPGLPRLWLVLSKPEVSVSTSEVFEYFDRMKIERRHLDVSGMVTAIKRGDVHGVLELIDNDLQEITAGLYPEVKMVQLKLLEAGARKVLMTGSGPTCFGVCDDLTSAQSVAERIRQDYPQTWVVHTN